MLTRAKRNTPREKGCSFSLQDFLNLYQGNGRIGPKKVSHSIFHAPDLTLKSTPKDKVDKGRERVQSMEPALRQRKYPSKRFSECPAGNGWSGSGHQH
ncbi:hypothetical protein TNCV_1033371 [Trichonephila clavipes]|nr:hypothetical protein TNCV_1033371 [Trichonephila clavipes]